jgi:hypothetical protein
MCIDTLRELVAELEILGGAEASAIIRKSGKQRGNMRGQTMDEVRKRLVKAIGNHMAAAGLLHTELIRRSTDAVQVTPEDLTGWEQMREQARAAAHEVDQAFQAIFDQRVKAMAAGT